MKWGVLALLVLGAAGRAPSGQSGFVDRARDGSVRFRDQAVAIAEGYRPIGPDAPAMGQHWVNLALATDGVMDPTRPPILSYTSVEGRTTLVGIAFVAPLPPGRTPPDTPAGQAAWHVHARALEDEGHVLSHVHGPAAHDSGWRVAVLHVWAWVENPDGPFAAENWALPFVRLGLVPSGVASRRAARALGLAQGGDGFLARQLRIAADLPAADAAAVAAVAREYADRVAAWALPRRGTSLDAGELAWLESAWRGCGRDAIAAVSQETVPRMRRATAALDL